MRELGEVIAEYLQTVPEDYRSALQTAHELVKAGGYDRYNAIQLAAQQHGLDYAALGGYSQGLGRVIRRHRSEESKLKAGTAARPTTRRNDYAVRLGA